MIFDGLNYTITRIRTKRSISEARGQPLQGEFVVWFEVQVFYYSIYVYAFLRTVSGSYWLRVSTDLLIYRAIKRRMNSWKLSGYLSIKNNLFLLRYVCAYMVIKKKEHVKERSSKISKKLNVINNFFFYFYITNLLFFFISLLFCSQIEKKKRWLERESSVRWNPTKLKAYLRKFNRFYAEIISFISFLKLKQNKIGKEYILIYHTISCLLRCHSWCDPMIKGVQITRLSRCRTMNRDWSFLFCNPSLSCRSSLAKRQVIFIIFIIIVYPDLG